MTAEQFCYWLQGYFELRKDDPHARGLNAEQTETIQDHLNLVFKKVTPERKNHDLRNGIRNVLGWFEANEPNPQGNLAALIDGLKSLLDSVEKPKGKPRVLTEEEIDKVFGKPVVKMERSIDPFDRPDVYCSPSAGPTRIC